MNPDGASVYVTGFSLGLGGIYEFATISYDALTGKERWVARFGGPGDAGGFGYALGVSPDGAEVFATGEVFVGFNDYGTVAYDARTGAKRWAVLYGGDGGYSVATALAVNPEGRAVYITGSSTDRTTGTGYATVAYSTGTGRQLWARRYSGPDSQEDDAYAIATTPDGDVVFVTGRSYGPTDADFATVAYKA